MQIEMQQTPFPHLPIFAFVASAKAFRQFCRQIYGVFYWKHLQVVAYLHTYLGTIHSQGSWKYLVICLDFIESWLANSVTSIYTQPFQAAFQCITLSICEFSFCERVSFVSSRLFSFRLLPRSPSWMDRWNTKYAQIGKCFHEMCNKFRRTFDICDGPWPNSTWIARMSKHALHTKQKLETSFFLCFTDIFVSFQQKGNTSLQLCNAHCPLCQKY